MKRKIETAIERLAAIEFAAGVDMNKVVSNYYKRLEKLKHGKGETAEQSGQACEQACRKVSVLRGTSGRVHL